MHDGIYLPEPRAQRGERYAQIVGSGAGVALSLGKRSAQLLHRQIAGKPVIRRFMHSPINRRTRHAELAGNPGHLVTPRLPHGSELRFTDFVQRPLRTPFIPPLAGSFPAIGRGSRQPVDQVSGKLQTPVRGNRDLSRDIDQLTDVTRPGMRQQQIKQRGRSRHRVLAVRQAAPEILAPGFLQRQRQVMCRQQADILGMFSQRQQTNLDRAKPVSQCRTKVSTVLVDRRIRRRDDTRIERPYIATDYLYLTLLESAQKLRLQAFRRIADLIEEQGAAVGLLDVTEAPVGRTREGTARGTKSDAADSSAGIADMFTATMGPAARRLWA